MMPLKKPYPQLLIFSAGLALGCILSLILPSLSSTTSSDAPLARFRDQTITAKDVHLPLERALQQNLRSTYRIKKGVVESEIRKQLLEKNKDSREQIEQTLKEEITWLIHPEYPKTSLGSGRFPRLGPWRAPIEIIFVGDQICPSCRQNFQKAESLRNKFPDKVKVHFRFAFDENDNSDVRRAAEASHCADEQNKFWEFNEKILSSVNTSVETLSQIAKELGLNSENFDKCLSDRKFQSALDNEIRDVADKNVFIYPALVINGHILPPQINDQELEEFIQSALTRF